MRDLIDDLRRWLDDGRRAVLARVVDLDGSGPRDPGAAMAVCDSGEVIGSVSGGCVEGAVVAEALDLLAHGGHRLVEFGVGDDEALSVGLTCGGTIRLFLTEIDPAAPTSQALFRAIRNTVPATSVTIVDGPGTGGHVVVTAGHDPVGRLDDPDLQRVVLRDATAALSAGTTVLRHYGAEGQAIEDTVTVFFETFAPPPRLIIFGAVDFTAALVRVAKVLGFHVTVCDAREVFATRARFPLADDVVVDWPHRYLADAGDGLGPRDAICVLTHDPKFDVPAIVAALRTEVGYLGAMGSRRTTEDRAARLRDEGVTDEQLDRLLAPIGLDLGARTPEETAIAICAEIIAERTGRPAPRLRDGDGSIHR